MRAATSGTVVARIAHLLDASRGRALAEDELIARAGELAELLFRAAAELETPAERARRELLRSMLEDPAGQAFTTLLADRVHRSRDPRRVVDAARQLLRTLGIPRYLPAFARMQLGALLRIGPFVPGPAARGLHARLARETSHVVLDASDPALTRYLEARKREGAQVNVNLLGEAVLGNEEADARLAAYRALLARPDVEHVSVKVSALACQLELLAWDETVAALAARLRCVYEAALAHSKGTFDKLVTLDMEAYKHFELTLAAFRQALEASQLETFCAGIALQAYLPESAQALRSLTALATQRVSKGGAPIRVRLVKGANLLAERVESALHGWQVPILPSKPEVDASYKRMLLFATEPEHARAVHLGVGSHNVFDLALALVLGASRGLGRELSIELLEGMADSLRRVLQQLACNVLVYTPIVPLDAMHTAIAYLMRRLDEGTTEENFLRRGLLMQAGDTRFAQERAAFERAVREREQASQVSRRAQDRASEVPEVPSPFRNQADTDFAQAKNRAWIARELERVAAFGASAPAARIALGIGGLRELREPLQAGFDPSRPRLVPYEVSLATAQDVERALSAAAQAAKHCARLSMHERAAIVREAGLKLARMRGELIATMAVDAGKRIEQADIEVSEAIDFAFYYAELALELSESHPELAFEPAGVGLVTPPWNFPLAIPAGGVFALLMAGYSVILKPALETPLVADALYRACAEALERCKAPEALVQLVTCEDEVASALVRDPRVGRVVLTGATSTARLFTRMRPGLALSAETGGKNAIIVSARADRDQAIEETVASAFGHAGQKCSACSLLVLEAEVHDDPAFLRTLADAASSLSVGSALDPKSVVTPLIKPPEGALLRAITTLEPGESWLIDPKLDASNPRLLSPGIKLGVREGSFMHQTELFGPVLSVMRADDLEHALRIANGTPYGLTAGFFSLDEVEQSRFLRGMRAGNLYVNRGITGAVVRRQPFGGLKASAYGRGAKAGGPNYVFQLGQVRQLAAPKVTCAPEPLAAEVTMVARSVLTESERERLSIGACSYAHAYRTEIGVEHDPSELLGERNLLCYLPCSPMLLRASDDADPIDVLLALAATRTVGAEVHASLSPTLARKRPRLAGAWQRLGVVLEEAPQCAERVAGRQRARTIGSVEPAVHAAALEHAVPLESDAVLLTGRIELLRYVQEQARSVRYHRFGNLAGQQLLSRL